MWVCSNFYGLWNTNGRRVSFPYRQMKEKGISMS
eukprot:gene24123-30196_t